MATHKTGSVARASRKAAPSKAAKPAARKGTRAATRGHSAAAAASGPAQAAPRALGEADPFNFAMPWLQPMTSSPMPLAADQLLGMQQEYVQRLTGLWNDFFAHPERTTAPIADPRFADPSWQKNSLASFYARTYLLNSEFMKRLAESVQGDRKTRKRVKFAVSQWVDAASPANFFALNPKAQQTLLDTSGESLKAGLGNLLNDIGKGKITQTDESAFEVGKNVATSEGAVVYQNPLFQLIQYKPLTEKVYERPFLLVPPCINKFYILDLQPENSFIRYAVEQGHTVFVVSWKNPHKPEAHVTWEDYVEKGIIEAIHVTQEISGQKQINALGYCVGGTLIANGLAVMYARGEKPITSLTMLTALLDFEDAGVLDVFIDENQVRLREQQFARGGIMPGLELSNTFSSLRANDLVWSYVVSNYLEGKSPPAFDLLYWNGDGTNLPGPMYAWYLRNMYLENNLRVPGKLKTCGQPVDLGRIQVPTYVFAAREDHIVPWKAAYASARALPGDGKAGGVRFVMGASGHIAGAINPPSKNKRSYWAADDESLPANSEAWFNDATERPGSWWPDWSRWLARHAGSLKPAPKRYGDASHKPLEPAPGSYVKEKA
ncbi:MAG TPA: class I poly(R)-hydroxyalkanoic acid synthase [Burkholderiaceae bacterium]|nr:class I poly(R)-hydroxyalkanoic acid synthase [Burkholderiaceae bacterium]